MRKAALGSLGALAALALASEAAYRGAAAKPDDGASGRCAVLVLGYPTRSDGAPDPIQRFRVEAGVAVQQAHRCPTIVFSGGAVHNRYVEAETMAAIAKTLGVSEGETIVEPNARNTWQNVGCSARHLRDADRVFVVSDSLHARRARRYACRQDAALCSVVVAAGFDPPLRLLWWKVPAALHELAALTRDTVVDALGPAIQAPACASEPAAP